MYADELPGNCGVVVIDGLHNLRGSGYKAFKAAYSDYCKDLGMFSPIVVFSDKLVRGNSHARTIAAAIRKAGIGEVTKTQSIKNPNSKNQIEVFTWVPTAEFKQTIKEGWDKESASELGIW